MEWESNIFYYPEKHGLTTVACISYDNTSYQFDYRVVWREDMTGILYTARDSGCSCPTPFEGCDSVADMNRFYLSDIENEVYKEQQSSNYYGDNPTEFLATIRQADKERIAQGRENV